MSNMRLLIGLAAVCVLGGPALAGEITGNGKSVDVNGRSEWAYSGLNDSDGNPMDPGGFTQSFGTNVGQFGLVDPASVDPNSPFFQPTPGWACNPNRGRDLNAG